MEMSEIYVIAPRRTIATTVRVGNQIIFHHLDEFSLPLNEEHCPAAAFQDFLIFMTNLMNELSQIAIQPQMRWACSRNFQELKPCLSIFHR